MSNEPRIITRDNCPPEFTIVDADTPLEYLRKIDISLGDKNNLTQGVIWFPGERFKEAMAYSLTGVFNAVEALGYQNISRTNRTFVGKETRYSALVGEGAPPTDLFVSAPLLLQIVQAAKELCDPDSVQFKITEKCYDLPAHFHYDAHFGTEANRLISAESIKLAIKAVTDRNKFLGGRACRIVWNEAAHLDSEERVGTMFMFPRDIPELANDERYETLIANGKLYESTRLLKNMDYRLDLSKAWQLPNDAVCTVVHGNEWSARKSSFHSWAGKNEQEQGLLNYNMFKVGLNLPKSPC